VVFGSLATAYAEARSRLDLNVVVAVAGERPRSLERAVRFEPDDAGEL